MMNSRKVKTCKWSLLTFEDITMSHPPMVSQCDRTFNVDFSWEKSKYKYYPNCGKKIEEVNNETN